MRGNGSQKLIAGLAVCFFLLAFVIASFLAQDPLPSPTPSTETSPQPSPSASATPTPPPRIPTPTPYPGAQNAHQWGSVTVFNGLPSDSVRAIAQTADGVMWFGTDNGLARFDGRRIQKVVVGDEGNGSVTALRTLPTGQLIVGTSDGAWVQSAGRFEIVSNLQGIAISTIFIGAETLIGTDAGNVFRLASSEQGGLFAAPLLAEPLRAEGGSPMPITSLTMLGGKVFAATSGRGVFVIEGGTAIEFRTTPRPAFVNSLVGTAGERLWMGTEAARAASGVFSASESGRAEKLVAPTADVFALEANDGGLWAGTERFGLFHFADGKLKKSYTFANTSGGLRSDTIYTLFTDREGVLWIGTNRGVSRFDFAGTYQETVSDSPNSNFVRTFFNMWAETPFAGTNRGLFVKNDDKLWISIPALRNKVIYAINRRPDGTVIVGTPEGVFDLSGRKSLEGDVRDFVSFSHFPSAKTYKSRQFAAVYGKGLVDITGPSPQLFFSNKTVTAVSVPTNGSSLWIGTGSDGLFKFDGLEVKKEAEAATLQSGAIWDIFDDGQTVYLAAEKGVFAFRDGNAEKVIQADDVRSVYSRDGHIWAATTTRGILHARQDDRFGWLVTSIGFEQGLPSEKAFLVRPAGEDFLIATNRGLVWYKPGLVPPKLIPVRVLSQRVHDPSETASTIDLDYPQNSILIEVAGQSSRTFPEEFQYAYVLTDAKGEVIDSRVSSDAQYSPQNLPAGAYTITATAFDRDLNSSEPLAIRFSVATAPFPWTATALGVLLAIALFGLAWAVIEHRRIRLRTNELAAARFDLANEAERERRRIARDLHDQTLADLRNLMINSDKLADNGSFRSEIESVSTEIRRICEDLSPSVLENVGLVAALEFLLSRTVENGKFHADDSVEESIAFPLNVQLQIYRIAQEVLTNISKHSHAAGVEMRVKTSGPNGFAVTIRDNGKLFQPAAANGTGRGVANIRSRANLIGAKVKWKIDKEGWNAFTMTLEGSQAAA